MEIIQERLEREFNIDLIATAPSVNYHVYLENEQMLKIENPSMFPDMNLVSRIEEPYVVATIMCPDQYVGPVMELCQNKRGIFKNMTYIDKTRVSIIYEMPLAEIIYDFF